MNTEERIKDIEGFGARAKGKKELISSLQGEHITARQALYAKCYDCMGYYVDGRYDCLCGDCPLYFIMPFRGREPPVKSIVPGQQDGILRRKRGRPPKGQLTDTRYLLRYLPSTSS